MTMQPKANANTNVKGNFLGTTKKHVKTFDTKKGAATANKGDKSFGQATTLSSGKKNFSRGAPGHSSRGKMAC